MAGETPQSADEPFVLYSIADGVATIMLNRPAQLNPLSHGPASMQRAIIERLIEADADDNVGCVAALWKLGRTWGQDWSLHVRSGLRQLAELQG